MLGSLEFLSTGDIQYTNPYGTWTLTRVPVKEAEINKECLANKDLWTGHPKVITKEDQMKEIKSKFTCGSLEGSTKMHDAWADISGRMDRAIEQFMDGTMSEDQLAELFQSLSHELFETSCRAGYPLPIADDFKEQAVSEAFYDEARRRILDIAVNRNNEQGKQYLTGDMNPQRSWKYYNSDYYYKSGAAIAAVTKGMEELAQANDWEFTIPDYKGKGYNLYYNFNTAFSNSFSQSEQYLIDPDMEPPQGFEWFFQTGGDWEKYSRRGVIEAHYTINPDGSKNMISQIHRDRFDPTDFYTGNTWFAYTDENGKRHMFSTDVFFTDNESDLMNVGSLFKLPDGEEWDAVRRFLKNLQLYPKGYFTRIADPVSFNYQA